MLLLKNSGNSFNYILNINKQFYSNTSNALHSSAAQRSSGNGTAAGFPHCYAEELPLVSLSDIVEFKSGIVKTNPYQGLLKDRENSPFRFGFLSLFSELFLNIVENSSVLRSFIT
jgi:hypothetical protein